MRRRDGAGRWRKVVSLFEPHANMAVKGGSTEYGYKVNLTTGRSGLVLGAVMKGGADAGAGGGARRRGAG